MELYLMQNDPARTLLTTPDGVPQYAIETPRGSSIATTIILRLGREAATGQVSYEIGRISHNEVLGSKLSLTNSDRELVILPSDPAETENSWAFTGPDDRPYKWQIFIQYPVLMLNDNSHTPIARYRRAKLGIVSRSRRAFLEIMPAGINIIDFTVVTFVSFMKQRVTIDYHQESSN